MEGEENIEAVPSEDNGNVPAHAPETPPAPPSEPVKTETPAVNGGETPPAVEPELFELPDGRKVDAGTLSKEWRENFMPEFTRKSQALATVTETINPKPAEPPKNPLADPNYIPQTYEELAAQIEARIIGNQQQKEEDRVAQQKAVEDMVVGQLTDIKKTDPTLNENALFQHAVKYGFRDLKQAHQNMKDMSATIKATKEQTANDINKRKDPVSTVPGATGGRPDPAQFTSATEYLRALK